MIAENGTRFSPAVSTLTLSIAVIGASLLVAMLAQELSKQSERGR